MHKLHSHPIMERRLGVPGDHVIVDRHVFERLGGIEPEEEECHIRGAIRTLMKAAKNELLP